MTDNVVPLHKNPTEEQQVINHVAWLNQFHSTLADHLTVLETMRLRYGIGSEQFEKHYLDMIDLCKGGES